MKTIVVNGQTRHFGRVHRHAPPRLHISRYLDLAALPSAPAAFDYGAKAAAGLATMLGNDAVGDCVAAGIMHAVSVHTGNADAPVVFSTDDAISFYSRLTGYVPGDPSTDNGTNEIDAMNYMVNRGIDGNGAHKWAGYVAVDPTNQAQLSSALWVFETAICGAPIPDAWTTVDANGFVWDAGTPNPQNGHCFCWFGVGPQGPLVSTWGMRGTITWAALKTDLIAQAGGEVYIPLSAEIIARASQKAPCGVDFRQLVLDLNALGANLPVPPAPAPTPIVQPPSPFVPPPIPVKPPVPKPLPTKAQVEAALQAALDSLYQGT